MSTIPFRNVNDEPVEGVIEALEKALDLARKGELRSVSIFGLRTGDFVWTIMDTDDIVKFAGQMEVMKTNTLRRLIVDG